MSFVSSGAKMSEQAVTSYTVYAPVKGQVLVKMDGAEEATVVADFEYDIPVQVTMPEGALFGKSKVRGY